MVTSPHTAARPTPTTPATLTFTGPTATLWGAYYPTGYLVAVLPDQAAAARAVAALAAAGLSPDAVAVWSGAQVLATHAAYVQRHSRWAWLGRLLPTPEALAQAEYLAAAQAGRAFVTVAAPQPVWQAQARAVLVAEGGQALRFYGTHTITEL